VNQQFEDYLSSQNIGSLEVQLSDVTPSTRNFSVFSHHESKGIYISPYIWGYDFTRYDTYISLIHVTGHSRPESVMKCININILSFIIYSCHQYLFHYYLIS
jgi:hypothetical protein